MSYAPDERNPDRLAASLQDFSRVIAASPKNAAAYFVRGDIHFDLKQYAAAYSDFSESLELQPDQPAVLFNRSLAAEHLGRAAEAAGDRRAARTLDASIRARGPSVEAAGSPTQIEFGEPGITPAEPRVVFAAPRAAPETPANTASEESASTPEVAMAGYQRIVANGQERFCKTEAVPGSHIETAHCYSKQQLAANQEHAKRYIEGLQRLSGLSIGAPGTCPHSAGDSCISMQGMPALPP